MDIENKIKVTLSKEDIEQAIKDYAGKGFDEETNKPSFESIEVYVDHAVLTYKGYPWQIIKNPASVNKQGSK